jgi:hypothetical protein
MVTKKIKIGHIAIVLCLFLGVVAACSVNKEFQVVAGDTDRVWQRRNYMSSQEELNKGYKLYVSSCGNCHNLISPAKYTADQWDSDYLQREFTKAKVTDESTKKLISYYIYAKAK